MKSVIFRKQSLTDVSENIISFLLAYSTYRLMRRNSKNTLSEIRMTWNEKQKINT